MKDSEWLEHEYKRLKRGVGIVKRMRTDTIHQIKFARLQGDDDKYLFKKWVNLDRQLVSVKDRRDLVYRIWKF